jgi:molybdopterin/thiamine biosynthesis adenylyltransferase
VALVDRPPFLTWPHVERDGLLCLASNTLEIDPNEPVASATAMLGAASDLVEMLLGGDYDSQFRNEFVSYWNWAADASGPTIVSLIDPMPPTRAIRLWRGRGAYVIAETDAELERWLVNRFGKKPNGFDVERAALLWLDTPLVPNQYPATGQDLRALTAHAGRNADALLFSLVRAYPRKIVTVLGMQTANGPALAGVIIPEPTGSKHGSRDTLSKGFRRGAVPDAILLTRYVGGTKPVRRPIERADALWIHGRGQDERAARLRTMRVAIVGCGSLGGPVALSLAQAGLGQIILIDFDTLRWANVGRHPLGASSVGDYKAKALGETLRSEFPHMIVDYRTVDIDTVLRTHPNDVQACDLILAATGSFAADARLDAWHATRARGMPIVYAWMEAHACAGHAVLIGTTEACLRCGFNNTGGPDFRVTAWPEGPTQRQEPACGAVFQPYGPVEIGFVTSLVSELVLDALLGEESTAVHRVWIGSGRRLERLGGSWSATWLADAGFRQEGAFIIRRDWGSARCSACITKAQAA